MQWSRLLTLISVEWEGGGVQFSYSFLESKDSDYVCGSCGTWLSTPRYVGIGNGVLQLLQT